MFFAQTFALPPCMHWKLTDMEVVVCKTTNSRAKVFWVKRITPLSSLSFERATVMIEPFSYHWSFLLTLQKRLGNEYSRGFLLGVLNL
jgi:hypothetical protein